MSLHSEAGGNDLRHEKEDRNDKVGEPGKNKLQQNLKKFLRVVVDTEILEMVIIQVLHCNIGHYSIIM